MTASLRNWSSPLLRWEQKVKGGVERGWVDHEGILKSHRHDGFSVGYTYHSVTGTRPCKQLGHVAEGRAVSHADSFHGVIQEGSRRSLAVILSLSKSLRVSLILKGKLVIHGWRE